MNFLVDACVGRDVTRWLRENGHDAVDAADLGADPGDAGLLAWAFERDRIMVTMDKDFGRLVYFDKKAHAGLVRLPDAPYAVIVNLIDRIIHDHTDDLVHGSIITAGLGRIRVSRATREEK